MPRSLKGLLVADWESVSSNEKLLTLPPVRSSVQDIFLEYIEFQSLVAKRVQRKHIVRGLVAYFNASLGTALLYPVERSQYNHLLAKHPGKQPAELYGAEHLLRLFGTCPFAFAFFFGPLNQSPSFSLPVSLCLSFLKSRCPSS